MGIATRDAQSCLRPPALGTGVRVLGPSPGGEGSGMPGTVSGLAECVNVISR
jgi:hypothetical protein